MVMIVSITIVLIFSDLVWFVPFIDNLDWSIKSLIHNSNIPYPFIDKLNPNDYPPLFEFQYKIAQFSIIYIERAPGDPPLWTTNGWPFRGLIACIEALDSLLGRLEILIRKWFFFFSFSTYKYPFPPFFNTPKFLCISPFSSSINTFGVVLAV